MDYDVYVINLDSDVTRLEQMHAWYDPLGVKFTRVPGIRGSYLPAAAQQAMLGPRRTMKSGTFGCFLSHVAAWERIAEGSSGWGLILEDDSEPLGPLPSSINSITPDMDADIVYVNERMSRIKTINGASSPLYLPMESLVSARANDYMATGCDAYFVSKHGAVRMLDFIRQDKFQGHVDVQLVATALSADFVTSHLAGQGEFKDTLLRYSRRRASTGNLKSYVRMTPLFRQNDRGSSSHRNDNAAVKRLTA